MRVVKILNNNLVLASGGKGEEVLVKGRGVGFHKKRGDEIREEEIEKVFLPGSPKISPQMQEYVSSIPEKYLDFVQRFVDEMKAQYDLKLNSSIYFSLSDHLAETVKRFENGISLQNLLLLDIRQLYKTEYRIGTVMVEWVEREFGLRLPEDEAGFFALHFVNAQEASGANDSLAITRIVSQIKEVIKNYYGGIEFDEESLYYQRFLTHLKYFAQRFLHKELQYREDAKLFEIIKEQYKEAFGSVKMIYLMMEEEYGYQLTEEEMIYLTIHIQTNMERSTVK